MIKHLKLKQWKQNYYCCNIVFFIKTLLTFFLYCFRCVIRTAHQGPASTTENLLISNFLNSANSSGDNIGYRSVSASAADNCPMVSRAGTDARYRSDRKYLRGSRQSLYKTLLEIRKMNLYFLAFERNT